MLVQKEGQKPYTKITSSVKPPLKRQNFDNLKIPDQHHGLLRHNIKFLSYYKQLCVSIKGFLFRNIQKITQMIHLVKNR